MPDKQDTRPPVRHRCTLCGNIELFDVTLTRTTKAYHHFTVGGELNVEDEEVLTEAVEEVSCRWCGTGANVIEIGQLELNENPAAQVTPSE